LYGKSTVDTLIKEHLGVSIIKKDETKEENKKEENKEEKKEEEKKKEEKKEENILNGSQLKRQIKGTNLMAMVQE
jgi:prephenate dehydrogenase